VTTPLVSVRRILVPVDFSTRSANALEYAVALGSSCRAAVDVLHVWHSDLATHVTVARDRAKRSLRDFVAELALRGDVELRRRIDHGDACLTIQRTAQLGGYDLLVVAGPEPGRGDADSVARRLLCGAPTPVLFVPAHCPPPLRSEQERLLKWERILVPIALAGLELAALDYACELSSIDGARVEALLSSDALPTQVERWRARPKSERVTEFELAEVSDLCVPPRVHNSRCDLLVMSTKRAQAGERARDTRSERIALSVPCASLSLPA
jgi:nucleotide-binding universal stress UspA family protein